MPADVYYSIGSTHQVCQDFAIANGTYVIISDGCSSAKDSDWGARLLTKSCQTTFEDAKSSQATFEKKAKSLLVDFKLLNGEILTRACNFTDVLGISRDCLAATLLATYIGENSINAFIAGDGYIVARNKNKRLTIISHIFESGAPYYLYYNLNDNLKQSYFTNFGNGNFIIEKSFYDGDKLVHHDESSYNSLAGANFQSYSFPRKEYDLVAVISDGLKTFTKQVKSNTSITNQPVPIEKIVKDIFNFKTLSGQFVHRRCQRILRDYANENIKHNDDLSIGVLYDANT